MIRPADGARPLVESALTYPRIEVVTNAGCVWCERAKRDMYEA